MGSDAERERERGEEEDVIRSGRAGSGGGGGRAGCDDGERERGGTVLGSEPARGKNQRHSANHSKRGGDSPNELQAGLEVDRQASEKRGIQSEALCRSHHAHKGTENDG